MQFEIVDRPMGLCCGLVQAGGFNAYEPLPPEKVRGWIQERAATNEDRINRLKKLIKVQENNSRNVALIALSDEQKELMQDAQKLGFNTILEFYNPNSGNQVHLMARIQWKDKAEYFEDARSPDDEEEEDD